ncbi:ROK family transcriptional regulator [Thermus hydrothermalis]
MRTSMPNASEIPKGGTRQLRRWHKARILDLLRKQPGLSRSDLARHLELSPSAVTEAVAELLEEGLLLERPLPPQGQGRPSIALEVEGERNVVLAWEIDVDRMAVALMSLAGDVRVKTVLPPAPRDPQEALALLAATTYPLLSGRRVLGVGVAVPGLVEPEEGHLTLAPNLGWQDLALGEMAQKALASLGLAEVPLIVENEANAAAYGLYALGGWEVGHCVYLNLGVGVGGGVVVDRKVYHGARFHAGEVGHIPLNPDGPSCGCGKQGCAEVYLSFRRWNANASKELLAEIGDKLAHLCAIVLSTLDPNLIVLGGPLVGATGEELLREVRQRLPKYALRVHSPEQVVLSPFGREAALLGAGALAAAQFIDQMAFVEVV